MAKKQLILGLTVPVFIGIVALILVGGFFFFSGDGSQPTDIRKQEYSVFLDQKRVDLGGENEKSLGTYTFSCLELRRMPCLNSGETFDSNTGSCTITPSIYNNCDSLSAKICQDSLGVYDSKGKHCDLIFYEGFIEDALNLEPTIYEYPLANFGGTIKKRT